MGLIEGYVKEQKTFDDLENRFTYHKPIENQPERYEHIRAQAKDFAETLITMCPESRELSLALTNLEQSVFWANASIARNEKLQEAESEN